MAVPRSMHAARTMRKNSFKSQRLVVSFDVVQLGRLLQHTLPKLTMDRDLADYAQREFHTIQMKLSMESSDMALCRDELLNCSTLLSSFLSSARQLPGSVIFEAHCCMGCIQETLRQDKLSSQSFTKALWIASCTEDMVSIEQLAVCLHRLGRVYGVMGRYKEANDLLKQALLKYDLAHIPHDHVVVSEARQLVTFHDQRLRLQTAAATKTLLQQSKYKKSSLRRSTLSLIREESCPSERRSSL